MCTSLKAMLDDQAASVAFKAPDLEAIARTGGRRIRRRRVVTGLAALAALATTALVAGAVVLFAPATSRSGASRAACWRSAWIASPETLPPSGSAGRWTTPVS